MKPLVNHPFLIEMFLNNLGGNYPYLNKQIISYQRLAGNSFVSCQFGFLNKQYYTFRKFVFIMLNFGMQLVVVKHFLEQIINRSHESFQNGCRRKLHD